MRFFVNVIASLVIFFGFINLIRMMMFLVGSNLYEMWRHRLRKKTVQNYPKISIVIPVYNEEKSIIRCIQSVLENDYPEDRTEIIVVDDGSTDSTYKLVSDFLSLFTRSNLKLVYQLNSGKAHALNNGMKNYATGEFVMCLDSDSYLDSKALKNIALYFEDPMVMALSANVKIAKSGGFLNLIQRIEYIICYQMKRAQTSYNIEYIIGGIGSTFRKKFLEEIDFYDGNTVTEDIDLTMKILRHGNKNVKVIYGSDVIAYTQSVLNFADLIKQRYRWKWGRCQTFLKNKSMFFSKDKSFTKGLTWFYLPYALFNDFAFLLEPITFIYIISISIIYKDLFTLVSAFLVMTIYNILNIVSEHTIPFKDMVKYILLSPIIYPAFYVLSLVEYIALLQAIKNLPNLNKSLNQNRNTWQHVNRQVFTR